MHQSEADAIRAAEAVAAFFGATRVPADRETWVIDLPSAGIWIGVRSSGNVFVRATDSLGRTVTADLVTPNELMWKVAQLVEMHNINGDTK